MFHGSTRPFPLPVLLLLFLWLLPCLPAPASAGARELRIATFELGGCGRLEQGRPAGFCFELGNALAREAGLEPRNRLVPLARGVEEMATGGADVVFMPPDGAIRGVAEDIGRVGPMTVAAWARVETPLRDVRDLGGKTVAVVRGLSRELDRARELKFLPVPCRNYELGFKMLLAGRVQAVIGPLRGLAESARRMGMNRRFLGTPLVLERESVRAYVSLRVPGDVRERLREALERLVDNGTVDRLRDRDAL
jgi:polar amino acid transport system substrate-binding protein